MEKKDSVFFQQGSREQNMILGEMYGVRAMLRLFSPSPASGHNGSTIPYVRSYPEYQPTPLNMQEVFTHFIS